MRNRKDKPLTLRLLSSIGAFLLIGSAIYMSFAGLSFLAGVVFATAVLSLGVPSISSSDSVLEVVTGFF
jgi:hypothetical protein